MVGSVYGKTEIHVGSTVKCKSCKTDEVYMIYIKILRAQKKIWVNKYSRAEQLCVF